MIMVNDDRQRSGKKESSERERERERKGRRYANDRDDYVNHRRVLDRTEEFPDRRMAT